MLAPAGARFLHVAPRTAGLPPPLAALVQCACALLAALVAAPWKRTRRRARVFTNLYHPLLYICTRTARAPPPPGAVARLGRGVCRRTPWRALGPEPVYELLRFENALSTYVLARD